jgi:hypothetical protein
MGTNKTHPQILVFGSWIAEKPLLFSQKVSPRGSS